MTRDYGPLDPDASPASRASATPRVRGLVRRAERRQVRTIRIRRRTATTLVATFGLLGTAGAAFAYWTSGGSGSGSATVAGAQVSAAADGVTGLYPGATQTMTVRVTNGNAAPYAVTTLTPDLSGIHGSCTAGAWVIGTPTPLPTTVAANTTAAIPVVVSMATGAPSECQGKTISVPFSVMGTLR